MESKFLSANKDRVLEFIRQVTDDQLKMYAVLTEVKQLAFDAEYGDAQNAAAITAIVKVIEKFEKESNHE